MPAAKINPRPIRFKPVAALALPKHCERQTVKGHDYLYARLNTGRRIRLREMPGTPAFTAEYARAIETLAGAPLVGTAPRKGSVRALASAFLASAYFAALSATQQERYRKRVERFAAANGHRAVETMDAAYVGAAMAEIASLHERTLWRQSLSNMCRWGSEQHPQLISRNPFLEVARVKLPESKNHRRWMPEHMAAFRAAHPIGSRERLAFELITSTLARGSSDVRRFTRAHIKDGLITWTAQKNGEAMDAIPLSPLALAAVAAHAEANPTDLVFFRGRDGKGTLSVTAFATMFRAACKAAGLDDDLTPHGLRHAGACEAAERGESVLTIQHMLGDRKIDAAMEYVKQAEGAKMRAEAHKRRWQA